MQILPDPNSFRIFPYPPNGNGNCGGFDLVRSPERIDEIKEFETFPELKPIIARLNAPTSKFMTFGLDHDSDSFGFAGYIDLGLRESKDAQNLANYQWMFDSFESFLIKEHPDKAIPICNSLSLKTSQIHYPDFGKYVGYKICLFYRAQSRLEALQILETLFAYLLLH